MLPQVLVFLAALALLIGALSAGLIAALLQVFVMNVILWGFVAYASDSLDPGSYWPAVAIFTAAQLLLAALGYWIRALFRREPADVIPKRIEKGLRFSASREIAQPPSVVFPYLVQPNLMPRWIIGVIKAERLDAGELTAGSRSRYTMKFAGRKFTSTNVVLDVEWNHLLVEQGEAPWYRTEETTELRDAGGSSLVKLDWTVAYRSPYKVIEWVLRLHHERYVRDHLDQSLQRLALVVETPDQELKPVRWSTAAAMIMAWQLAIGLTVGAVLGGAFSWFA